MKITKVTVLTRPSNMDYVTLDTEVPNPVWPYEGTTQFVTWTPKGEGVKFAEKNFPGIELKLIEGF